LVQQVFNFEPLALQMVAITTEQSGWAMILFQLWIWTT